MPSRRPRPRGFTLVELAIVLAVIATIVGVVWAAGGTVFSSSKTSTEMQELQIISSDIRELYQATSLMPCGNQVPCTTQGSDVTCAMVTAGVFPNNMLVSTPCTPGQTTSYPVGPEGGPVSIFIDPAVTGGSAAQFEVLFSGPGTGSLKTCGSLLGQIANTGSGGAVTNSTGDLGVTSMSGDGSTWLYPNSHALTLDQFNTCTEAAVVFAK